MSRLSRKIRKTKEAIRKFRFRVRGGSRYSQVFCNEPLLAALADCKQQSDISEHLSTIFYHALEVSPRLIVELGTRGGESTRVLLAVAAISDSRVLSVDIHDCSAVKVPYPEHWHFVRDDDVDFGRERFSTWCGQQHIEAKADVIFIDTSHLYEHTTSELAVWSGHLRDAGVMILHDTNMGCGVYGRCDGSVELGWDNRRGVIRGIEEFLGRSYNENCFFVDVAKGFLIKHYPHSNGLTVLKKLPVVRDSSLSC